MRGERHCAHAAPGHEPIGRNAQFSGKWSLFYLSIDRGIFQPENAEDIGSLRKVRICTDGLALLTGQANDTARQQVGRRKTICGA